MPHVHVLGLIHPEICRIEQRKVPKPPYMHHKGKWENGGKREREGDQRGRWDQVSKNEMQFFSSSALLYVQLLSCARLWLCGLYEDLRLGWYAMHIRMLRSWENVHPLIQEDYNIIF